MRIEEFLENSFVAFGWEVLRTTVLCGTSSRSLLWFSRAWMMLEHWWSIDIGLCDTSVRRFFFIVFKRVFLQGPKKKKAMQNGSRNLQWRTGLASGAQGEARICQDYFEDHFSGHKKKDLPDNKKDVRSADIIIFGNRETSPLPKQCFTMSGEHGGSSAQRFRAMCLLAHHQNLWTWQATGVRCWDVIES